MSPVEVVIGMDRTTVTVNEDVGTEELCASIMSGTLQREVVVPVLFMDRGAKGDGKDKIIIYNIACQVFPLFFSKPKIL